MSVRSIPIYPAKLNFWVPKTPLFLRHSTQTQYDAILNFTPIFCFSTLCTFYVKMATSQGGLT